VIDYILIDPVQGTFDIERAAEVLRGLNHTARDPHRAEINLVAADPDSLDEFIEERRAHPDRFPPSSIRVGLDPERIWIACRTLLNAPVRDFVKWLRAHYDIRFLDEELNDLTHAVDENLDYLFGTPP